LPLNSYAVRRLTITRVKRSAFARPKKDANVISERELVVGLTYFTVTYPDPTFTTPIVLSYKYLGRDIYPVDPEDPGASVTARESEFFFRFLPPFKYEDVMAEESDQFGTPWRTLHPELFSGHGDAIPTSFTKDQLRGLLTIDGLVAELTEVKARQEGARTS
jgi:hypothetical protein